MPATLTELTESSGELNIREIQLLYFLRTRFRFGDVTIHMRDGIPYRILRAFESLDIV